MKRFSHGFQCSVRCFDLIQRFEFGSSFVVELVHTLCNTCSNAAVLRDILSEILKTKPEALVMDSSNG